MYYFLIIHYWLLTNFAYQANFPKFTLHYWLYLLPIISFCALSFRKTYQNHQNPVSTGLLAIYIILSSALAGLRGDYSTLLYVFIDFLPLVIFLRDRPKIKISFVNTLFLVQILFAVLTYHLGYNLYGYIPGQAIYHPSGAWWRISLFPFENSISSGFFSLIVLVLNWKTKELRINARLPLILLSSYFLFLSGNKTAIIILLSFIVVSFFQTKTKSRFPVTSIGLIIALLVASITSPFILELVLPYGKKVLGFVYSFENTSDFTRMLYSRFDLIADHLSIFKESLPYGAGNFNIKSFNPESLGNSESRLSYYLARDGIAVIPLILFFLVQTYKSTRGENLIKVFLIVSIFYMMNLYGSVMIGYNFIFLLVWILYFSQFSTEKKSKEVALGT